MAASPARVHHVRWPALCGVAGTLRRVITCLQERTVDTDDRAPAVSRADQGRPPSFVGWIGLQACSRLTDRTGLPVIGQFDFIWNSSDLLQRQSDFSLKPDCLQWSRDQLITKHLSVHT